MKERSLYYREYARAYNLSHRPQLNERRRGQYSLHKSALDTLKLERGCLDCGYRGHPAALDFDHVRGIKRYAIGKKYGQVSIETLLEEVGKCEVRCANCHRIRTLESR